LIYDNILDAYDLFLTLQWYHAKHDHIIIRIFYHL